MDKVNSKQTPGDKGYKMIKGCSEATLIERKSEFISHAAPVYSEEEAVQFINSLRKKYYNATHNCYAYIIGESSGIQRSSDDGEPSGTAGIPILEVIRKEAITNTIIVVTRYFGGTLLGAGGLIRAYTESAAKAVRAAGLIKVQPFAALRVHIDYSYLGKLQYEIPRKDYILADVVYSDLVDIQVLAGTDQSENLKNDILEWTNGSVVFESEDVCMLKLDESTGKIL